MIDSKHVFCDPRNVVRAKNGHVDKDATDLLKSLKAAFGMPSIPFTSSIRHCSLGALGLGSAVIINVGLGISANAETTQLPNGVSCARPETGSGSWTCKISMPNGFATVTGVPTGSSAMDVDLSVLNSWIETNLGDGAIALGNTATIASGVGSIAIGQSAEAVGGRTIAIGYDAAANGMESLALGSLANANGMGVTAVGHGAGNDAAGDAGVYIGLTAGKNSNGKSNSYVGDSTGFYSIGSYNASIGAGAGAQTSGSQNTSSGFYAGSLSIGDRNVSSGAMAGFGIVGDNNVSLGAGAATGYTIDPVTRIVLDRNGDLINDISSLQIELSNIVAIGTKTYVTTNGAVALGEHAEVTAENSIAIGSYSRADGSGLSGSAFSSTGNIDDIKGVTPVGEVSIGSTGKGRRLTNVAAGSADTDAVNISQLKVLDDRTVKYDGGVGAVKDRVTLAGATSTNGGLTDGTIIANLARGSISSLSTDAVNGAQLWGIASNIALHLGGSAYGITVNSDGTLTAPSYVISTIGGSGDVSSITHNNVGDALNGLSQSLINVNSRFDSVESNGSIKYFHTNSSASDSQALGNQSVAVGPQAISAADNSIAIGDGAETSLGANSAIALGESAKANHANSVALGSHSKTQEVAATAGVTIKGKDYAFAGESPVGTVSIGDKDAERTITNVAAGRISSTSTDAINGSQLNATNMAIENLNSEISQVSDGAVKYDKKQDGSLSNSVTLIGGDPNAPVLISNVATGVSKNDAVNVGQLQASVQNTLSESKSYTDNQVIYAIDTSKNYTDQRSVTTLNEANNYTDFKFGQLNQDIGDVRSEARQAAAIGLAAASLRYDDRPGKASVAFGGGFWRNEGAISMGAGYTSEDSRVRSNVSATTSGGNWGVGAGISFTIN
ncbi:YadA-like family protein [Brucella sp. H1_1004]|uniref:YadA-like family protein n=1 Tax=Brucella sp. H1_1004 TaxID=3110109 RepID=UPI0039B3CCCF